MPWGSLLFFCKQAGLGQRTDTLFQSALQPSQSRSGGRRHRLGQQAVDGWGDNKAFS